MADTRRFKPYRGNPDTAHRDHYGAPLVELVLALADGLIALRRANAAHPRNSSQPEREPRMHASGPARLLR